jgi:hypothetical protein
VPAQPLGLVWCGPCGPTAAAALCYCAVMTETQMLNAAGLALQFLGVLVAASGVLLTKATAGTLAGTYWDENPHLKTALLKQSRRTVAGLIFMALGTALQLAAILLW